MTVSLALLSPTAGGNSKQDYETMCSACHGFGVAGAPKFADREAWRERLLRDREELYSNAINGFTGASGVMPPRGGFAELDDSRVRAIVDYMLDAVQ